MKTLSNSQRIFIFRMTSLYLSINGRLNFHQFSRFSNQSEHYFRYWFSQKFIFLKFNSILLESFKNSEVVLAFDPCYVPKTGKHTRGVGYFWSGCAKVTKWGLEIGGLALVDLQFNTAFHLEAFQTLKAQNETLIEFYAKEISNRVQAIQGFSKYLVVDAYFSKKKGRGRPRKFDGKINFKDLYKSKLDYTEIDSKTHFYSAVVWSEA